MIKSKSPQITSLINSRVFIKRDTLDQLTSLYKDPTKLSKKLLVELFGVDALENMSYSTIPQIARDAVISELL